MEKVIIRKNALFAIYSRITGKDSKIKNLCKLVSKYGKNDILKDIFEEQDFTYEELCEERNKFLQQGNSSVFTWMYRINSEFGVSIDSQIRLYHYNLKISEQQQKLFGWEYDEVGKYLGNTGQFSDEEILKDVQSLSAISFFRKYRII